MALRTRLITTCLIFSASIRSRAAGRRLRRSVDRRRAAPPAPAAPSTSSHDVLQAAPGGAGCGRCARTGGSRPPARPARRISSRITSTTPPISPRQLRLAARDAPLEERELQRDRVERVAHLVGEPRGEGPQHGHLLVLDDAGLGVLRSWSAPRLLVEARVLDRDRGLRGQRRALVVKVTGALHGEPDLVAQGLQEHQLVVGEQAARGGSRC